MKYSSNKNKKFDFMVKLKQNVKSNKVLNEAHTKKHLRNL